MKTFSIAIAALALMAVSLPLQATIFPDSTPLNLCTQAVEAKKVVVHIYNLEQKPTSLRLKSSFGDLYYSELIRKHNGHRTLLDLEQLPEGRYILSVSQKGVTESQVIRITREQVLVSQCES